jgi:transitional endoplasmic reticulum ATPase
MAGEDRNHEDATGPADEPPTSLPRRPQPPLGTDAPISRGGMRLPSFRLPDASRPVPEVEPPSGPGDREDEDGGLVLRVAEARLEDVDQGIVRVDPYLLSRIHVPVGTAVTIRGQRDTVALAQPLPPHRHGRRDVEMDGMVRENAGVALGEPVRIRACEAAPAKTILLAPLDSGGYGAEEVAQIRQELAGRAVLYGDRVKVTTLSKHGHLFRVAGTEPEGAVQCGPYTDVRIKREAAGVSPALYKVKYEDVGGLDEELLRVRELVELPLKYPSLFARLHIEPPKGVLLHGPPGSGKTLIARAVASEVRAHFIHVNGPEIMHKFYGESEARLREIFEEAQRRAPSVIFLDEVDAIAPRRMAVSGEVEKRVVAQLLALMDGMVRRGEVVVIAATNLPEAVDPALRRPGRFDREVAIGIPSREGRLRILQIHSRGMPLAPDVDLERLADVTHGFVGADLEALCKEAGMLAVRDCLADQDWLDGSLTSVSDRAMIHGEHFLRALKDIEPTAIREFALEQPQVRWEDVGGGDEVRRQLTEALELPRRFPGLFDSMGMRSPTGFLLVGPPGTGKTLMVRALAAEMGMKLITVDPALVFSKWVGESEKAIQQVCKKAKQAAPCVLFFDHLEALAPARRGRAVEESEAYDRLASQLYAELDRLGELGTVVLIGATHRPELLDSALLRPGRFGFTIRIGLPAAREREQILAIHLRRVPLAEDVDLAGLAAELEGLSGAEIAGICQRAFLIELRAFAASGSDPDPRRFRVSARSLRQAVDAALGVAAESAGRPERPDRG